MNQRIEKAHKGIAMEGLVARFYDHNAATAMMSQYVEWADTIERFVDDSGSIMELACGPGYLSIELARRGYQGITGVDISRSFVSIANQNARRAGVNVRFEEGNAAALPFPDSCFSTVLCTSAFKNFSEPLWVLNEIDRVLVPNGIAWISDLRHDVSDETIDRYVSSRLQLSGINASITRWTFKNMLRPRAHSDNGFLDLVNPSRLRLLEFTRTPMEYQLMLTTTNR